MSYHASSLHASSALACQHDVLVKCMSSEAAGY